MGGPLLCKTCMLGNHQLTPFHRISKWNSGLQFFERSSLRQIGGIVHVGHPGGGPCRQWKHDKKTYSIKIAHTNGIHEADIAYCQCTSAATYEEQLLRAGIFPHSRKMPQTGFTFEGLDQFRLFNLSSKTSAWDYCLTLRKMTDDTQPHKTPASVPLVNTSSLLETNDDASRIFTRPSPL